MTGIYYCDMFVINGKGCVVMGHGKSKVCRNYTGDKTEELMTDFARFDIKDENLFAQGDFPMGRMFVDLSKLPQMKVDYFVYMQSEKESSKEIEEINGEDFIKVAFFNITFGAEVKGRVKEFENIISSVKGLKFITVPWGKTIEEKGEMIRKYFE